MTYTIYDLMINSPATELVYPISAVDVEATLLDATVLPSPAPNLLTFGNGEDAETCRYTAVVGNVVTIERGLEGTAKPWGAGTTVARLFCNYDFQALIDHLGTMPSIPHFERMPAAVWTVYTPLSMGGAGAEFATEKLSNGIERTYLEFGNVSAQNAYLEVDLPEDWDGGDLTAVLSWESVSASTNSIVMHIYGARFADNATSNVALTTELVSITDANNGAGKRNKSAETAVFTITGTGNHLSLKLTRTPGTGADNLAAAAKILGVTFSCTRTLT
jgi:hypothetical protein